MSVNPAAKRTGKKPKASAPAKARKVTSTASKKVQSKSPQVDSKAKSKPATARPAGMRKKKGEVGQVPPAAAKPAKPKRSKRQQNPAVRHETIKQRLPTLPYPISAKQFEEEFGMSRVAANMRLSKLVESGELQRLNDLHKRNKGSKVMYGLPGKVYAGYVERPQVESLDSVRQRLPDMEWPMTRSEMVEVIGGKFKDKLEWLNTLTDEGLIVKLGLGEHVYTNVDFRNTDHIRKRLDDGEPDNDYQRIVYRMPETFTSAMFNHVAGLSARSGSRTLARLVAEEKIFKLEEDSRANFRRPFTELPLTFGLGDFARHYGLDAYEAATALSHLVSSKQATLILKERRSKRTKLRPEVRYKITEKVRARLEKKYHFVNLKPTVAKPDKRIMNVDLLSWPMTATEYSTVVNLTGTPARATLDRMRLMGLLDVKEELYKGHQVQMYYRTNVPLETALEKMPLSTTNKLIQGHTRTDEAKRLLNRLPEPEQAKESGSKKARVRVAKPRLATA